MKYALIAAMGLVFASLAGAEESLVAAPLTNGELSRGAALAAAHCVKCHGFDGWGERQEVPDTPSLAGQHVDYLVKQVFNFKTGQRQNRFMGPAVNQLSTAEVSALARHFNRLAPRHRVVDDPGLIERGRVLYLDGDLARNISACAACHGDHALGGAQMPRLAGQNPAYLQQQLRGFIEKARTNDNMMHVSLTPMAAEELRALAYYLTSRE